MHNGSVLSSCGLTYSHHSSRWCSICVHTSATIGNLVSEIRFSIVIGPVRSSSLGFSRSTYRYLRVITVHYSFKSPRTPFRPVPYKGDFQSSDNCVMMAQTTLLLNGIVGLTWMDLTVVMGYLGSKAAQSLQSCSLISF